MKVKHWRWVAIVKRETFVFCAVYNMGDTWRQALSMTLFVMYRTVYIMLYIATSTGMTGKRSTHPYMNKRTLQHCKMSSYKVEFFICFPHKVVTVVWYWYNNNYSDWFSRLAMEAAFTASDAGCVPARACTLNRMNTVSTPLTRRTSKCRYLFLIHPPHLPLHTLHLPPQLYDGKTWYKWTMPYSC